MLDPSKLKRAEAIFHDVVDLPRHERGLAWSTRCDGDHELRLFVEQLLSHHDSGMAGFLSEPAGASAAGSWHDRHAALPERVGSFEVLRKIGEGGMGVVYEAAQSNPRRTVALKILRGGRFIDAYSVRLFQREIEALARLRHPCVAAIYEAGCTEDGQHYFAMELVQGRPLPEHLVERRPGLRERLQLFRRVCDAIHYAHQRGVMHRDLKPTNILIDEEGNPKILDFGLARLADANVAGAAAQTATGRIQGTLAYMSPEQARGDPDAIDIRTDVYSLGVILYEMLTGRLPYEVTGVPLPEAVRAICTHAPARPLAPAAGHTGSPSIKADLQTIVLKALEKEPQRRYASAAALSEDTLRFMSDQPIVARPASTLYQLRKLVDRHRWPSALVAVVLVLILSFGVSMSVLYRQQWWEWQRAEKAEERAVAAGVALASERDEARAARDDEAEQRRLAEQERVRAQSVTDFLLITLGLADPDITQTADMTMKAMLDRTAEGIAQAFAEQPSSEAQVRLVVGRAYASLGELDAAQRHLERALEIRDTILECSTAEVYEVLWPYVHVLDDQSDLFWRPHWWRVWRSYSELFAPHPGLAAAWSRLQLFLGSRYERVVADPIAAEFRHAAEAALSPDDPLWLVVADCLHLAGTDLGWKGKPGPGCDFLERALEIERRLLPETHSRVVRTLAELVRYRIEDGRSTEAEALTRHSLDLLGRVLPADHWYLAVHHGRLGGCLIEQGRLDEGEALLLQSLERIDASQGATSRSAREVCEHLIRLYELRGHTDSCDRWRRSLGERVAGSEQGGVLLGRHHSVVFGPEFAQVYAAYQRARNALAGADVRELIAVRRRLIHDDHPAAHVVAEWLQRGADRLANRGGFSDLTLEMLRESVHIMRAADYLHPWKKVCCLWWLAFNLEARGEFAEGEPLAREAVTILEAQFGNQDNFLLNARSLLGGCLVGLGRRAEAEPLLIESYQALLAVTGSSNGNTGNALSRVSDLYVGWGRPDEAIPHLVAYSKTRAIRPNWILPVVAPLHPELAESLEELRASPAGDRGALAARIKRLLAARAALDPDDPVTLLYADALYRIMHESPSNVDPLWTPAARDVVRIQRRSGAAREKTAIPLYELAVLEIERGDYAAAEPPAREGLELLEALGRGGGFVKARKSVLGAALAGQGRYAEAQELLRAAYPPRDEKDITSTQCFGYLIDLYSHTARPDAAIEFAGPVMRQALGQRDDADYMNTLAWKVVRRSGLGEPLHALALDLAAAACELDQDDGGKLRTLGAAYFRAGRHQEALAALTRADELNGSEGAADAAFLALTLLQLGEVESAREALARLRRLMDEQGEWAAEESLSLLREVEAMLEAP